MKLSQNTLRLFAVLAISTQLNAQDLDISEHESPMSAVESIRNQQGNELKVLAPTLSAQEIDPAVLNRLMQEIVKEPEASKQRLRIDDGTLQGILISLSNARSFINTNEMANIRMMCSAFDKSENTGEAQITDALDAYERRSNFTKNFISKYYKIVLADIEYGLDQQALVSFKTYMDDRRRRMATAGNVTMGIPTHNPTSGAEAVEFHCTRPKY